jgi:sec-independent protein translocase protein TatA
MPFSLSPVEMLFVAAVLLLLFGAKRLPELGSGLGKGIREFKRSIKDGNDQVEPPAAGENRIQEPPARAQVPPVHGAEAEALRRED